MDSDLLTVAQAAQLKGVSRTAIYDAISAGHLPHRRVLGRLAVSEADVRAWTPKPRPGRRAGTRLSEEAKARISQANKAHWARRKSDLKAKAGAESNSKETTAQEDNRTETGQKNGDSSLS